MGTATTRQFPARQDELETIRDFVDATCAALTSDERQLIMLVVEELFVNTIKHGYGGDRTGPVWLTLAPERNGVCRVTYEDRAPAHNPLHGFDESTLDAPVTERPVGGLGQYLVASLATESHYQRCGDRNVVELLMASETAGDNAPAG